MANDLNKKISIDVQVNSNAQEQTTAIKSLQQALAGIGKSSDDAKKGIDGIKGQLSAPPDINPFKNFFSNILGFYRTTQKSMSDSAQKTQDTISTNTLKSSQNTDAKVLANAQNNQAKIRASAIGSAQKIENSVFGIVTKGIAEQSEAKVRALEADRKAIANNASLTADEKKQQENKIYAEEYQVKLKAFKQEQKAGIAQAIINGAIAVTKAEADLGPIAGTLALGAIVAQTAAQVATIERQHPPQNQAAFAKGGYFTSDGRGSLLPGYSPTDNTNAQLRSGEAIVVSEAMRDPWARNLVSAINVAYGGRDFSIPNPGRGYAVGGIFTDGGNANRYYNQPMNDQKNLANTIAYQMINNFPPVYVDVKDINNQQNILAQTINRVNL